MNWPPWPTHAGVVVLGVDDRTRAILGIPLATLDLVETWLRGLCNALIESPLDCVIRKLPIVTDLGEEKVVIRVDVPGSLFVH